jgi:hypothetical protein
MCACMFRMFDVRNEIKNNEIIKNEALLLLQVQVFFILIHFHTSTVHVFIIHQLMSLFLTFDLDFFTFLSLDFLTS